jgi:Uncharacterized conserved protein
MKIKVSYSEYNKYCSSILEKSRYGFANGTQRFLNYLLETSIDKVRILPSGEKLFRTQRGHDEIEEDYQLIVLPYKKDRMLPKADKVKNGRVNPVGIPVLYLSDDYSTAIAETRPWLQETISLATFITLRDLRVLDLSNIERSTKFYLNEPKEKEIINKKIWSDVSNAFSRPVTVDDQEVAYTPTQVIGEYFKIHGFDGICYRSLLGNGKNYALFDISATEIINGVVMEVKKINIEAEQYGNHVEYKNKGKDRIYNVIEFIEPKDNK